MSHVLLILFYLYFFPRISLLCARWLVTRHSSELKVKLQPITLHFISFIISIVLLYMTFF